MPKKLNVAVLMGGKSSEHEVSLMSGKEVVRNLDSKKYKVIPIKISKDGQTFRKDAKNYVFSQLSTVNCQLFFIALHGPNGEDGTVQGFLQLVGLPYTGSKVLASALAMDKIYSRKLFTHAGLKTPEFQVVEKGKMKNQILKNLKFPVFVKPHNQGSSVGTTKVVRKKNLRDALDLAFSFSRLALVEEYIDGVEITCAVLGNDKPKALPLVEIVPKTEFFDYEAKYNESMCNEICPARINRRLTKKAQSAAIKAYKGIGCQGFGRVDMIIKDNEIYVLEVNTIPGLTPISLLPKAAKAAGINYSNLLEKIISYSNP